MNRIRIDDGTFEVIGTLRNCQRCGKDHDGLTFDPLDNAVDEWKWWALCPETFQPVLMAKVDK